MLVFSSSDFFEVYLGVDQKKVAKSVDRINCNILCNFNNSLSAKIKVQSFTAELLCAPLGTYVPLISDTEAVEIGHY